MKCFKSKTNTPKRSILKKQYRHGRKIGKNCQHATKGVWTLRESNQRCTKTSTRKPLIEEGRGAMEMLEEFNFYSNLAKGSLSRSEKSIKSSIGKNRKRENGRILKIFSRKLIDKQMEKVICLQVVMELFSSSCTRYTLLSSEIQKPCFMVNIRNLSQLPIIQTSP